MLLQGFIRLITKILFFTGAIDGGNSFPRPLGKKREAELLEKMWQGDGEARNLLITHNMRLVAHVAKKFQGAEENDDLISVGTIGLIKAINTYSPNKGTHLATFASRCIENEILMLLRANKKHRNVLSLSDTFGEDKDGNELTFMDLVCVGEDNVFSVVDKKIRKDKFVRAIRRVLTKREFDVLDLRYGLTGDVPLPQRTVAARLRISRSYVSRIEKKAVLTLRDALKKDDFYMD